MKMKLRTAAGALAIVVGVGGGAVVDVDPAVAGACEATTRKGSATRADLRIYNRTERKMTVRFYRSDTATINLKSTVDVEPGDEGHHAFRVDGNTPVTGIARIQFGKYIDAYVCSFRLENVEGVVKTRWDKASCSGSAQPEGCPTCANTCDKSWDDYKNRWRTKLSVTE